MDPTDAMVMGLTSFKIALVIHIGGALLLFAALGLESFVALLLRLAKSVSQVRLAARIGRYVPMVFGWASALVLLSGSYLTYLNWHYGENIGWVFIAASAFVGLGIYSAITGRRYAAALRAEIAKSGAQITKGLQKLVHSRGRIAQIGVSVGLTLGILVVMIFQPSVSASILVLINALAYGLIFSLIPQLSKSGRAAEAERGSDLEPLD
ncbi:MAG TPA: hypothetical protein VF261_01025 [Candidatus Saccharimonadales bacterium]